jgi:hypothetical protein
MPDQTTDTRLLLGIGEEVQVRPPTPDECRRGKLDPHELVIEYRHTDRDPDILPASGVVLAPRLYGLRLPTGRPDKSS